MLGWGTSSLLCVSLAFAGEEVKGGKDPFLARQITIAPGPLQKALSDLAMATNLEILVDPALTSGRETGGVSGIFTAREGLRAVLVGSGLSFDWMDDSVVLRRN